MPITVSTAQSISTLAGITQTNESQSSVVDSITVASGGTLTVNKAALQCTALRTGVGGTLVAGSDTTSGTFATTALLYIQPAAPENNNFSTSPPVSVLGAVTLRNVDIVAGSNLATTGQTGFIGEVPVQAAALTNGANRIFKNVRVRAVNRNGISCTIPECVIDGLGFDKIDLIFFEKTPVSMSGLTITNSNWGGACYDTTVGLSSSTVSRLTLQKNSLNGTSMNLTDVAVTERLMFRFLADASRTYTFISTFGCVSGTAGAVFTLFDKANALLTTGTADASGNLAAVPITWGAVNAFSLGLGAGAGDVSNPNDPLNFYASSTVVGWQTTLPARYSVIKLPLKVVHTGYGLIPAAQTITTLDFSVSAYASGQRFAPKLAVDVGVTLSQAAASALSSIATLDDFYDAAKAWAVTPVNAWYADGRPVIASGSVLDLGTRSIVINSTGAAFSLNTTTNVITINASALTKGVKFDTIKTTGSVTFGAGVVPTNMAVQGSVTQATPTNLTGVSITGNLTYTTNAATSISFTNVTVGGALVNTGTGVVTIAQTSSSVAVYADAEINYLDTFVNFAGFASGTTIEMMNLATATVLQTLTISGTPVMRFKRATYAAVTQVYFQLKSATGAILSNTVAKPLTLALGNLGVQDLTPGVIAADLQSWLATNIPTQVWAFNGSGGRTVEGGAGGGGGGVTLAEIEASAVLAKRADLEVINTGVKNASLLVPHGVDLP